MKKGPILVAVLAAAAFLSGTALARAGASSPIVPSVTVNTVGLGLPPVTLKTSELAILPQQTISVPLAGVATTETGPLLSALVTYAGVQFNSTCKNDELRYWVEVTSADGSQAAVITSGELDPLFGNRPAILALSENGNFLTASGPQLVVPNDSGVRDIKHVATITVGRAPVVLGSSPGCGSSGLIANPPAGTVLVNGYVSSPQTFTVAQLQAMPQVTQTDNFLQGSTPNTNLEVGPTLWSLIQAAKPKLLACDKTDSYRFYAEITSSEDGISALVAFPEIDPSLDNTQDLMAVVNNNIPVLNTDTDPRLTTPGDVRGGRYIFGAATITVFRVPTETRIPSCAGMAKKTS
jgi:hypothetical protein